MTACTFNPIVHVNLVRSNIPEDLVTLPNIVSEKKGGHEKRKSALHRVYTPQKHFKTLKFKIVKILTTSCVDRK